MTKDKLTLIDKGQLATNEIQLGYKPSEIAVRWGCSEVAINNALKVFRAPEEVKQAILDDIIPGTYVAEIMDVLTPEVQVEIVRVARATKLKKKQVKALIRETISNAGSRQVTRNGRGRPFKAMEGRSIAEIREALQPHRNYSVIVDSILKFIEGDPSMDVDQLLTVIQGCETTTNHRP
jgi:hypothetical protein